MKPICNDAEPPSDWASLHGHGLHLTLGLHWREELAAVRCLSSL